MTEEDLFDDDTPDPTEEELFAEAMSKPERDNPARAALDARRASGGISHDEYVAALEKL